MSRKKISTTIYVTPEQSERLRVLHERTKVPVAVYIREGIDLVLRQYGHLLPPQSSIRNFSIIAHIDHGKSTLADRILEVTGRAQRTREACPVPRQDGPRARARHHDQGADVRLAYTADGQSYELHLIDTPGHVDFNYEVSRSLAACEGAVLVVDATQGVEAQTLANVYLAIDQGLEICPFSTRSTFPAPTSRRPARRSSRSSGSTARKPSAASGKTGVGVPRHPRADRSQKVRPRKGRFRRTASRAHLRLLVRQLPRRRGMVRIVDGMLKKGDKIRFLAAGTDYEVTEIGVFQPFAAALEELGRARSGSSPRTSRASTT
jgi:GTP-binding protein LepA